MTKYRYDELIAYLRQYPEKKRKLNDLILANRSQQYDTRVQLNGNKDPVYSAVLQLEKARKIEEDIETIERSARAVRNGIWYDVLIANLCYQKKYDCIDRHLLPTCHRSTFFEVRKEFLEVLNRKDWYMCS